MYMNMYIYTYLYSYAYESQNYIGVNCKLFTVNSKL